MKIVVLNGSPRKGGNTEIMTQAFTKGAEKKGHEVVNLPVGTMKIRGCMACEYCFSHNGECAQKDDMTQVYAELKDADMVVFASLREAGAACTRMRLLPSISLHS